MSLLTIAHRGANLRAPENTVAAFRLGLQAGCDGSECDVQLSHDGTLMVYHDETLARLVGLPRRIPDMTTAQLGALQPRGPGAHPTAETTIPTLETIWRLHQERGKQLLVELKYFSEDHTPRARIVEAVAAFVERHRPGEMFHAISFDEPLLHALKVRVPTLRTGYVFNDRARWMRHQAEAAQWATVLLPRADCVAEDVVDWAHASQRPVYAWVADDESTMARLARAGVDGLLTNDPFRLVPWARRRHADQPLP